MGNWRLTKVSGTTVGGRSWRIAKITGSVSGGAWRITTIRGLTSQSRSSWRIARIAGAFLSGWRIMNIGGVTGQATTPVLSTIATQTVDPVTPVTIVVTTSNGVTPDSYSFTSPGITFTVVGNKATFSPPGTLTGGTVTVTITATKGANTSSPITAVFLVNPAYSFYKGLDGNLHPQSPPYYQGQ